MKRKNNKQERLLIQEIQELVKLQNSLIQKLLIMATLNGINSKMKGSAGQFTFRRSNGVTIVSEKVTETRNPRTPSQMATRTKLTNIVAMYKGIRPLLSYGFESKAAGLSDYNMFVRVNMQQTPVYLTKQMVAGGACIAAPYQITQGSLPAIVITGSGNSAATDIFLGSQSLSASTTVADFSKAVVDNNPDYRYGDQISYFIIRQKVNEATKIPYCQFEAHAVILDAADTSKLWDIVPKNGFYAQDGCIGKYGNDGDCVFAWVHSRKSSGKTLVSSQSLIDANSKLAEYQGEMAYSLAASSYGERGSAFLTPNGESSVGSASGTTPTPGGSGGSDSL